MKYLSRIITLGVLGMTLTGCGYTPDEETPLWVYSSTGAAIGGMAGGYVGSGLGATVASVGGAAVGGLLGYQAGILIEEPELRDKNQKAFELALNRQGSDPILWEGFNKDGTNIIKGSVSATPVFYNGAGQTCRRVTQILTQKDNKVQDNFLACRAASGDWDLQKIKRKGT